jgi:hypothetical protein
MAKGLEGACRALAAIIVATGFGVPTAAGARDHPGCAGKDNNLCDTVGLLINMKGKGCLRVMKVVPAGDERFVITCELASYDRSLITYTLTFVNGRKSYTVE